GFISRDRHFSAFCERGARLSQRRDPAVDGGSAEVGRTPFQVFMNIPALARNCRLLSHIRGRYFEIQQFCELRKGHSGERAQAKQGYGDPSASAHSCFCRHVIHKTPLRRFLFPAFDSLLEFAVMKKGVYTPWSWYLPNGPNFLPALWAAAPPMLRSKTPK